MPKYIRTKDGIYEVVEDNNKEWGKQIVVKFPKNLNMKLADVKDHIIKQSDNLAELCDYFLLEDKIGLAIFQSLRFAKECKRKNEKINFKTEIYGVIHIKDKGLIYVAKMNENGNLELIV